MSVYIQKEVYSEYGLGSYELIFIITDVHSDIISGTASEVNIFKVNDTDESYEDEVSKKLVQDELGFTMLAEAIRTNDDTNCMNLVLSAQNTDNKVYCALFLLKSGQTRSTSNMIFSGIILNAMDGSVNKWKSNSNYSVERQPLIEWKCKAKPIVEGFFDEVGLKDDLGLPLISSGFKSANVANRLAWWQRSGWTAQYDNLVNLNKLLREYADNVEAELATKGFGSFTITINSCLTNWYARPARWKIAGDGHDHYVGISIDQTDSGSSYSFIPYTLPNDDPSITRLVIGDHTTDTNAPFISYRMVEALDKEFNESAAKSYRLDKLKTFTDLLYAIALNFGLDIQLRYLSATELDVTFKSDYNAEQCYLIDAISDKIKIEQIEEEKTSEQKSKLFYAKPFYFAGENANGVSLYGFGGGYNQPYDGDYEYYKDRAEVGTELLFSTNTVCRIRDIIDNPWEAYDYYAKLEPHNMLLVASGNVHSRTASLHTGIYYKVQSLGQTGEQTADYFAPVGAIEAKINGANRIFNNLSEYLHFIKSNGFYDDRLQQVERTIDIPYLNAFSRYSNGSNYDWSKVHVGNKIVLDGANYTITSVKRNYESKTTSITIKSSGRFDFSSISAFTAYVPKALYFNVLEPQGTNRYIAQGAILEGDVVALYSTGVVIKATSESIHYDKLLGIAIEDANSGDELRIKEFPCKISSQNYSFAGNHNKRAYLRYYDSPSYNGSNVSFTPLLYKSINEDLFVNLGLILNDNTVQFDKPEQRIYKP